MKFEMCEKRQSIISESNHTLVVGGPGSGKTTLALVKCKEKIKTLKPGQKILFLSFSHAAVHQIINRCNEILSKEEIEQINVRTYHSFCWDVLHSHGTLLGGMHHRMLSPSEEGILRTQYKGDWNVEKKRWKEERGLVCFDLFASTTAELLEGSTHLREWFGKIFPLVILDEFQDSDEDQWRFVQQFCKVTQVVFLADTEQRIYEGNFRPGVNVNRLKILKDHIEISEFDLCDDNYRSSGSDILAFGNSVLSGTGPLPSSSNIFFVKFEHESEFASKIHATVAMTLQKLKKRGVDEPKVAVLTRSNSFVAKISDILELPHMFKEKILKPIPHDVVWDQELSVSAGVAIAAALEYKSCRTKSSQELMHTKIEEYFLIKKDHCERYGGRGAKTADSNAKRFQRAKNIIVEGKILTMGSPKVLQDYLESMYKLNGDPLEDWKAVRMAFNSHKDLKTIFQDARMVRLFRASDVLTTALADRWIKYESYHGASRVVRNVLKQEKLIRKMRDTKGVTLMTIHKSKGREYDGIILVEGHYSSPFFLEHEYPDFAASRRLLRVGITRARHLVVMVRPINSRALVNHSIIAT